MSSKLSRISVKTHFHTAPHFQLWLGENSMENGPLEERLFTLLDWHVALFRTPLIFLSNLCLWICINFELYKKCIQIGHQTQIRSILLTKKFIWVKIWMNVLGHPTITEIRSRPKIKLIYVGSLFLLVWVNKKIYIWRALWIQCCYNLQTLWSLAPTTPWRGGGRGPSDGHL